MALVYLSRGLSLWTDGLALDEALLSFCSLSFSRSLSRSSPGGLGQLEGGVGKEGGVRWSRFHSWGDVSPGMAGCSRPAYRLLDIPAAKHNMNDINNCCI